MDEFISSIRSANLTDETLGRLIEAKINADEREREAKINADRAVTVARIRARNSAKDKVIFLLIYLLSLFLNYLFV